MKKTFRSILAGALALFAVSCYDDSYLQGKLQDHEDRLTAIESILNAEVNGINDLVNRLEALEDKVAAIKVETVDGVTTLTLSNESKVVLSKNGALTVVDGGWATVAADGTVTPLGVKVGHDLQFKVENGELMISYDGAKYEGTGVQISEYTAHVIGNVVEDESSVTLTIGDSEYVLPLLNLKGAVKIKSGKQFFGYAETKTISVGLSDVTNLAVMNQPYGWKAALNGSSLVVTSPSEANADADPAGVVVLHGESEGKCITAVLNVALGTGLQISVDDSGMITVVNPNVSTTVNWWGDESTGFTDYVIGFVETSIYDSFSSKADFVTAVVNDYDGLYGMSAFAQNIGLVGMWDAVENPIDVVTVSIEQLGQSGYPPVSVEKGKQYVVWAVPNVSEVPDGNEIVCAYYEPIELVMTEKVSSDDIQLTFELYGAESVYIGAMSSLDVMSATGADDITNYLMNGYGMGGPWKQFQQYGFEALQGQEYKAGDAVSVSELAYGCVPGTKYYVWVVPVLEGKKPAEYVFEKHCKIYEYTTEALKPGAEEAELTLLTDKVTYSEVYVDVTVPAGTTAYAKFFEAGDVPETDEEIIAYILGNWPEELTESGEVKETYLDPGASTTLVVLTVSEDGKYAIAKGTYSTKAYPIVDTITATLASITSSEEDGATYYTAKFNVTGATKIAVYQNYSSNYNSMTSYILSQSTTFTYADVVDGVATVKVKARGASYDYMLFAAFNVDAEGAVTNLMQYNNFSITANLQ